MPSSSIQWWKWLASVAVVFAMAARFAAARAQEGSFASLPRPEAPPSVWTLEAAVNWALENNPELAAKREQRGIAAAGVVIAQTYPFNPVWEAKIRSASGPETAGITNVVSNEHKLLLEVEIRGQGSYRREGANAALSRAEWEIAFQEQLLAARVIRSFDAVMYRREKLRLIEATVKLNEDAAEQIRKSVALAKLRPADLLLVRTEVDDSRAQLGPGRSALVLAGYELRRALGLTGGPFELQGELDRPMASFDVRLLLQAALDRRGDLHAF